MFSACRFVAERGSSRLLDHVEHLDKVYKIPPAEGAKSPPVINNVVPIPAVPELRWFLAPLLLSICYPAACHVTRKQYFHFYFALVFHLLSGGELSVCSSPPLFETCTLSGMSWCTVCFRSCAAALHLTASTCRRWNCAGVWQKKSLAVQLSCALGRFAGVKCWLEF